MAGGGKQQGKLRNDVMFLADVGVPRHNEDKAYTLPMHTISDTFIGLPLHVGGRSRAVTLSTVLPVDVLIQGPD